jgi:hypothetical protein
VPDRLNGSEGSQPVFELRATGLKASDVEFAVWQLPSASTPRLREPELAGRLKGRQVRLIEHRLLRRLKRANVAYHGVNRGETARLTIDESDALHLALLFRVLAPMRNLDRIRLVAEGVEEMSREEAGYWLGMVLRRQYPRRVLAALRLLLTTP